MKGFKVLHVWDIANVGYLLCRELRRCGIQASLLVPRLAEPHKTSLSDMVGGDFIIRTEASGTFGLIKDLGKHGEFDLYHAHYSLSPVVACALLGRRFIAHCHGTDIRQSGKSIKWRYLVRYALRKAERVLVSTPDLLDDAKHFVSDAIYLPNPIDTGFFKALPSNIDLHNGYDYVLFHPSILDWKTKGTDLVVSAYEKLRKQFKVRLVLVDSGPNRVQTHELVGKLKIRNDILFLPEIRYVEMPNYYNASDIILSQFGLGHFSLVTLEALACERAVVVDRRFPEYYASAPVLSARSEADIVEQVKNLIEDKVLRAEIGKKGREWVVQNHELGKVTDRLIRIYEDSTALGNK